VLHECAPGQPCSETSSVFIIRPTAQRYGVLVKISGLIVTFGEYQVMAQLIAKRVLISPLIRTDFPVRHPLLARGNLLP
jgi:hypothetical protein